MYAGTLEDMSKWTVADLLVWGELQAAEKIGADSGQKYWEERDLWWTNILAACKMDISRHTAYNMAATARAFPWARRRHTRVLSFEHHRVVTSREEEEQDQWLDMAEDGEWSVSKLRTRLYSQGDPLSPRISVMSAPKDSWPEQRVYKEVYYAFSLPTRWDTVEYIKELVNQIKGDIANEYRNQEQGRTTSQGKDGTHSFSVYGND
jgi:hypothetical protein